MAKNILLAGVGGQGTLLVSSILTKGLIQAGYNVKMSEIHGMAQRGGSVISHVRYGKDIHSPIIAEGQADVLIAFEQMEALRWLHYLRPDGVAIVNERKISSAPILAGVADYPEGILDEIQAKVSAQIIDAHEIAHGLGNTRVMNIVLLGALVKALKMDSIDWENIIGDSIKEELVDINLKAFKEGLGK